MKSHSESNSENLLWNSLSPCSESACRESLESPLDRRLSRFGRRKYRKFPTQLLDRLKAEYRKNPYPEKETLSVWAKEHQESVVRLRNWFRSQRKKDFENGTMKYDRKNCFSKQENRLLVEEFKKEPYPNEQGYKTIAEKISHEIKHIKNWFGYQRKKLRRMNRANKLQEKAQPLLNTHVSPQNSIENRTFNYMPNASALYVPTSNNFTRMVLQQNLAYIYLPLNAVKWSLNPYVQF